jgi:hypothetical protein
MDNAVKLPGFRKYLSITHVSELFFAKFKLLLKYLAKPSNWAKSPKFYILLLLLLRAMYVFMNERGLNPFKKNISKEHVFLTGAGMGIGRLMAFRFGKLGCKLSLADINK